MRPPYHVNCADSGSRSPRNPAFASLKVDHAALFIIDFNLQLVELLSQPLVYRSNQPVMPLVGVDQDHQIVSEPRPLPGRTRPKAAVGYSRDLWHALKDEPIFGHKEEFAALRVLAELIGTDLVLPVEDPEPTAAPTDAPTAQDDIESLLAA